MKLIASGNSESTLTYSFSMGNGSRMYLVVARSWGAVHIGAMVWLVTCLTSNYQFAIPLTDSNAYCPSISVSGQSVTIKSGVSNAGMMYRVYEL